MLFFQMQTSVFGRSIILHTHTHTNTLQNLPAVYPDDTQKDIIAIYNMAM